MKLKIWELALAAALLCGLVFSAFAEQDQKELSEKLIRLHVVANSDAQADQELKLKVRDRVVEEVSALVDGAENVGQAEEIIRDNLQLIADTAAQGHGYEVRVSLAREDFPTRDYDSFSLAAGEYETLRVVIGEGEGHNWWCVMFPPLCTAASLDDSGLDEDEIKLVTGEYKLKFKTIEILEWLKGLFE